MKVPACAVGEGHFVALSKVRQLAGSRSRSPSRPQRTAARATVWAAPRARPAPAAARRSPDPDPCPGPKVHRDRFVLLLP
ncbi:hypothetical protein KUCAC02_022651 [Chaenocephalus aceratus]|uniref:Uncharacterized protein n=1 Tax=Chaenocephalus aceratus TaxID=36190 RepID=A0ACB9XQ25_CHAAC|nr:hypothetical protein KUCAC02_022651 [Chaenocephalus aceratus]